MALRKLYSYLLYALAFSLSFGELFSRFILPLLLIFTLAILIKEKIKLRPTKVDILATLPIFFFILIIFTRDLFSQNANGAYLEQQLALPLLAIVFYTSKTGKLSINTNKVFYFLILGVLVSFGANFFMAVYNSLSILNGHIVFNSIISKISSSFFESSIYGGNYFMGIHFSHFMHPTYISLLINFGLFLTFTNSLIKRNYKIIMVVLMLLYLFLISSKTGLFSLPITALLLIGLEKKDFQLKKRYWLFLSLVIILFAANPRIYTMSKRALEQGIEVNENAKYSYGSRILVWYSSLEVIKNNLWVGTGPSKAQGELNKIYAQKDFKAPLKNNYNSHNQFLQTTVAFGLLGLASLLYMLFAPLKLTKNNRHFYISFLTLFVFGFLFESILARYQGIVIFSFLYNFMVVYTLPNE